jgi:DNA-binding transcriptional MocR family regulator
MPQELLAERIAAGLKDQIGRGRLPPGSRLNSLRDQALASGAAKNTVVRAYELLVADGFIEPRRGAGFFVTGHASPQRAADGFAPALDLALASVGIQRHERGTAPGALSLGDGLPPSAWLESCRLDRYMQKVGRGGLGTVFRYGDPAGYLSLRRNIAVKLQGHGIRAEPEQIVLTQGAYHAVDILIRHLVKPGEAVLVDEPGFYPTFNKLRLQGALPVGVPRTTAGPDLERLAALIRRHKPRLFFTQSCGHNPSGGDLSYDSALALVAVAERHGLTLVDDDALADFMPLRAPRIGAVDQLSCSVYVGSFSKSLSSVVRVGFLVCEPALARRLIEVKTILSLNSSLYAERTVDAVITEGRFRKHVQALQARSRKAMRAALELLDARGVEVLARPEHGLYLWARFPGVTDSVEFARALLPMGIALAPGAIFSPAKPSPKVPWFRFNVGFIGSQSRFEEVVKAARIAGVPGPNEGPVSKNSFPHP